jgi:uncharacterized protein YkwD
MKLLARIRHLTIGLAFGLAVVLVTTALPASTRPAQAATNCDVPDFSLDAEETAFLTIINNYRTQNGLATLNASPSLNRASVWMGADMAAKNYFNHTDSLGRQWDQRMAQCDVARVPPSLWSENIAAWYETAASVFDGWKNSPGHNQNMLNPGFRSIGIARVASTLPTAKNTTPGWYWVTDFSNEVITAPPPPANICGNPSISSAPNAASVVANTTMTFTATVTGCTSPTYLWYVWDATNGWIPQGTWTASNTFAWTPRTPGSYQVAYWATQAGGLPANGFTDTSFAIGRTVSPPANVCGNPALISAPNTTSLAANTIQTFTATVTGCTTPNYVWFVWDPVNGWIPQGTWTTSNTFTWTPRTPGSYQVAYWATQPGGIPANGVTDTSFALVRTVTP